jgi:hypothetical protein
MPTSRNPRTGKSLPAVLFGLCLVLSPLAGAMAQQAQPGGPSENSPSDLAREGLEQMLRALRLLVESIPQYELPEVLDNGDIIIRRKHGGEAPPAKEPEFDKTAT